MVAQLSRQRAVQSFGTMKREDDQELWDLLGRAGRPTLSPFFARNVLREVRQQRTWRENLGRWFGARRLIPAAAVAVAIIAAAITVQRPGGTGMSSEQLPETIAQLDPIDYEVVADLDDLLALEEDSLWTDSDISTL